MREFRITRTGSNELKNVKQYLDAAVLKHVGDMESILRLFAIALHAGWDKMWQHVSYRRQLPSTSGELVERRNERRIHHSRRDWLPCILPPHPTARPTGS